MAEIAITRMSSKGQVVIPVRMRAGFKEGESFIIIKDGKDLKLRSTAELDKKMREDLIFAKRTEEAYKRHEKGLFREMSGEEFLKELEKW